MIAEEQITTARLVDLAPTQITVGLREVNLKRLRWRERSSCEATNFLNKLRIPVVLGPNARTYLIVIISLLRCTMKVSANSMFR
jgi:hypothetical protein